MTSARRSSPSESISALSDAKEFGVLGAVLFGGDVPPALRALPPDVFGLGKSRIIHRHILKIADAGRKVDPITLAESLRASGEFYEIGGQPTIQAMAEGGTTVEMVPQLCEALRTATSSASSPPRRCNCTRTRTTARTSSSLAPTRGRSRSG